MTNIARVVLVVFWFCGCSKPQPTLVVDRDQFAGVALVDVVTSAEQEAEIRALVEQLVFADRTATNRPILDARLKAYDADGKEVPPSNQTKDTQERQKRYESCEVAFEKLAEFKLAAFPILIEHLNDDRQSINFRNHYRGKSVGDACYWNIYFQLQDRPPNYSEYGYSRIGRDGDQHPKPYWEGTPFDEAGGIKKWLEANKQLSYPEMQVRCLQWLLDREKSIGAPDPDSYFLNILPLEIRILERSLETGADVHSELGRLRRVLKNRDIAAVPPELLPGK
jgi:hypothetical protein